MNTTLITEIMTQQVHQLDIDATVIEARNIMDKYEINHLPVLDNGQLVGMLSRNDLNQVKYLTDFIGQKLDEATLFKSLSIEELMTDHVQFLSTESTVFEAVQIFSSANFHSLPVLERGHVVGMVSTKDLFGFFLTREENKS